jgi:hypothetical protein
VVWPQNHWAVSLNLATKLMTMVSSGLTAKLVALGFLVWASKLTATV